MYGCMVVCLGDMVVKTYIATCSNMDELGESDKQNNQATKEYMQFDSIKVKLKEQPKVSSVTYTYVGQL